MQQGIIEKNHMDSLWHDYALNKEDTIPITKAGLIEKASVVGRCGMMLLSCGTGAWRVRSSMNTLSRELGISCTADIGLMSIEYTCFDGENCFSQSLCLTNTGVNTSKLNRLENFINDFPTKEKYLSGEQIHSYLDEIERIHGLYSPVALGFAAAFACGAFTFLLGGGPVEMLLAFFGAGIGNFVRCKLTKHHFTLFLGITASVAAACLIYAALLKTTELLFGISLAHEAGYICSMLFIIPGFPFITSGIDLAKLDMRSGLERLAYAMIIILVATLTAWIMALILHLKPSDFPPLSLTHRKHILKQNHAIFYGIYDFPHKKNYNKELKDQMPVSLYGINKILNNNGIQTEYVRRFSDVEACQQIISHLKTGNPVVIEAKKGKWANSYHTMVLLGLTDTGNAIIGDSANRTGFGSKQRVKYESVSNLIKHMFACSVSGAKSANCYFGSSSGGGYILVNPNP